MVDNGSTDGKEEIARMEHLLQQQVKRCEALLEKSPQDEMLMKAIGAARSALASLKSETGGSDEIIRPAMQSYMQSVLDSTYYEECQLVEQEFPIGIASKTIFHLITSLATPAISCGSLERVATLLGRELLECVYWRVGSLMYMYCHTLVEEEGRREEVSACLIEQYCSVGVAHLELMLSARSPLSPDEDYICNDTSLEELLQKGIFSDVHMLALMYAGELCYWAWSVATASKQQSTQSSGAVSSDSKTKTVKATSSGAVRNSPLPKEENKTVESAESRKDTVLPVPSSGVVQPTGIATGSSTELNSADDRAPLDITNAEKSRSTCDVEPPVANSDSNCRITLEKTVQDLSLQDTEPVASECSNCASDIVSPERQLYCVMEHCQGAEAVENWKSRFNPLKRGQELLSKFVEVARGPLKAQGWNYGRAVQLLVAMKKAHP